jgi:hypothetical protein
MKQSPKIKEHHTYRDIYVLDSTTSVMLSELSSIPSVDSTLTIHTHYPYAFYRTHHLRFQIAVLALSLLKSLEIYTLFLLGAALVAILSGVPFLFSFVSGVCLEIHDIITSRRPIEINLPTPHRHLRLGGPRKVVLGASPNPRTSNLWWKFFWIVAGMLPALSVLLPPGPAKPEFVLTWAGFQLFRLVARILRL